MAELRFTIPARQIGGGPRSLVATAVMAGLAVLMHRLLGAVVLGIVMLFLLWLCIRDARAFTECTPDGIRTRGTDGLRQCPWPQVANIAIRSYGRGKVVVVITTD